MTLFYVFMTISTISIALFLFVWMYARWQKIAKNKRENWHLKALIISGIIAAIFIITTTAYWYAAIK